MNQTEADDWAERICAISVHPDSASRQEIADLAADLMECRRRLAAIAVAARVDDVAHACAKKAET